uniref:AlNc14C24G2411 protein n=1 Tax=Albugo laibachii Nc14 TaxID=890382 RepID=F0W6B1_9STRA|nr:AlNc14C24G2411 [Albugo laibachii Nc14]|eukprot:CCA16654.1 AlNc14C24G2411 [Albugo laibachii Nc14]
MNANERRKACAKRFNNKLVTRRGRVVHLQRRSISSTFIILILVTVKITAAVENRLIRCSCDFQLLKQIISLVRSSSFKVQRLAEQQEASSNGNGEAILS